MDCECESYVSAGALTLDVLDNIGDRSGRCMTDRTSLGTLN